MKTWYVEDAGGGCLAFSEVLVLVCENPQEVYIARVPLTWEDDLTLEQMANRLVIKMMEEAGVSKNDQLLVCSCNIFNDFHQWLTEEGYQWNYHKMDGLAHEVAEQTFYQQMLDAGFPSFVHPSQGNYRLYYSFVEKWIAQDMARQKHLKDRQKRSKPIEQHYTLKANNHRKRICNQCKKPIQPYIPLVEYQFKHHGSRQRWYFHPDCSPVKPGKNKLKTLTITVQDQITGVIRPCKDDNSTCFICGNPIHPSEESFLGYQEEKLYIGHLGCCQDLAVNLD